MRGRSRAGGLAAPSRPRSHSSALSPPPARAASPSCFDSILPPLPDESRWCIHRSMPPALAIGPLSSSSSSKAVASLVALLILVLQGPPIHVALVYRTNGILDVSHPAVPIPGIEPALRFASLRCCRRCCCCTCRGSWAVVLTCAGLGRPSRPLLQASPLSP